MKVTGAHKLATLFPRMDKAGSEALLADIAANGQHEPILLTPKGKIIDGVHRYDILTRIGVKPKFQVVDLPEAELLNLVMSKNFFRRQLTEIQKIEIIDKITQRGSGRPNKKKTENSPFSLTVAEACERYGVDERQVRQFRKAQEQAEPEIMDAVSDGEITINNAIRASDLPPEDQKAIAESDNPKAETKKRKRRKKQKDIAETAELIGESRYGVVYADPPWQFEPYSDKGKDRSAENHYPTMSTDDIALVTLAGCALDDCVLFLWATAPMLPDALDVMYAWGFDYKTNLVWVKDRFGTGYWARSRHELLLIGTRGKPALPLDPFDSVIEAKRDKHSAKPDAARDMIAAGYPEIPKLEMFARSKAKGWDVWGNEA